MKNSRLRQYMVRNRVFLHLLFSDKRNNTSKRLTVCTNYQANVVLHILHKIVTGDISMKKSDFEALKRTRRLKFLKKVASPKDLELMLKSPREKKVAFLKQFTSLYSKILKLLFKKD